MKQAETKNKKASVHRVRLAKNGIAIVTVICLWQLLMTASFAAQKSNQQKADSFDSDANALEELEMDMMEPAKASNSGRNVNPSETELKGSSLRKVSSSEQPRETVGSSVVNEINNLEFKQEGENSLIVISSRHKLNYKEQKNVGLKQYVYLFENTTVPERIERAYDTSEFASPVALFTLLQIPKSKTPTAKLIVQLREDKSPVVLNSERGITLQFSAPEDGGNSKIVLGDNTKLTTEESSFSPNQSFSGKPIERLEIKNMDIQDAIRLVVRSSGYNVVIGEDVTGKIGSLSLENIPWDQAFALLLQSKKLGYVKTGNVMRITTLKTLQTEKDEIAEVEKSKIKAEPLRTVLIPISYAKATELVNQGKILKTERGTIEVDNRSNTIIVRDVESVIGKMQKLFAMLDNQPPAVSISAKVVEVNSSFSRNYGVGLKLGASSSGVNADGTFPFSTSGPTNINIKAADFAKLDASITLGEIDGTTRILSNPTVSVNQNTKATIKQTLQIYIPVTTFTNGVGTTTFQSQDAELSLQVTPVVAGDGAISMDVQVNNDIRKEQVDASAPPPVDKRNIQTQILLDNGDTAVIGGAFQSTLSKSKAGFPGLMHLPLIGALFSSTIEKEDKNEILIFLTAKILNIEESFKHTF